MIVCAPAPAAEAAQSRFPFASWHVATGALVPELWRDGIRLARGGLVALTISPMVPSADWVAPIRTALSGCDAVGGAIEPAPGLRLADLAEYFCRYSRDMLRFPARESLDLAGDNAGYRLGALAQVSESWQDGF